MWQSPNQRVRAIAEARKREREKLKKPFHIRRVKADFEVFSKTGESTHLDARVILNDMTLKGMVVFCSEKLVSGQKVIVKIEDPKSMTLKGMVTSCQEYANGGAHILSPTQYPNRIIMVFKFDTPEEEAATKAFYEELNGQFLYGHKAA